MLGLIPKAVVSPTSWLIDDKTDASGAFAVGAKGVAMVPNARYDILYDTLRDIARRRDTAYYSEVSLWIGMNPEYPPALVPMLKVIDREEFAAGRPLLAAVVINKKDKMPGTGFIEGARKLGAHTGSDDRAYWVEELRRVHDYWSRD